MTADNKPEQRTGRFFGITLPRYSAVGLLAALILLLLVTPFVEDLPRGDMIEAILLTLVMVSAVVAVGVRRRTLVMAIFLVTPAVVGKWVNHVRPDLIHPVVFLFFTTVYMIFVVANLLHFILRAPRVDTNVLCAGLSGYLMLGLLWIPAYLMVARLNPNAFVLTAGVDAGAPMDGFHSFYFSFVTLCTVGYGDITPVSKVARMLSVAEAIAGVFYVTVMISRLVAVFSTTPPPPKTE